MKQLPIHLQQLTFIVPYMNLKASLEKAAIMMDNMNNGKGTAGQFLTNDSLYTNLNNSLESLNELLEDMKANPKRYVHFSVFGKKSAPPNSIFLKFRLS